MNGVYSTLIVPIRLIFHAVSLLERYKKTQLFLNENSNLKTFIIILIMRKVEMLGRKKSFKLVMRTMSHKKPLEI